MSLLIVESHTRTGRRHQMGQIPATRRERVLSPHAVLARNEKFVDLNHGGNAEMCLRATVRSESSPPAPRQQFEMPHQRVVVRRRHPWPHRPSWSRRLRHGRRSLALPGRHLRQIVPPRREYQQMRESRPHQPCIGPVANRELRTEGLRREQRRVRRRRRHHGGGPFTAQAYAVTGVAQKIPVQFSAVPPQNALIFVIFWPIDHDDFRVVTII